MDKVITLNIAQEIGADRYNGGWTKSVTGLNKAKSDGYSIVGEFISEGLRPVTPGLYLDCNIGGSRKNQVKNYTLVEVTPEGTASVLTTERGTSGYDRGKSGHDWAVKLWPAIDAFFAVKDDLNEASAPFTLWQTLDRALETEPMSLERQQAWRDFPVLHGTGIEDARNLLDLIGSQARMESGLVNHEAQNAQFEAHLQAAKTAMNAMRDLLHKAQNGSFESGTIEFSE